MLYYLKQEVIGEHADSILKGADIRYLILLSVLSARCAHPWIPLLRYWDTFKQSFFFQGC